MYWTFFTALCTLLQTLTDAFKCGFCESPRVAHVASQEEVGWTAAVSLNSPGRSYASAER